MAQAHLEIFQSEYHMLKYFGKYLPKMDVDASARLAPFLYQYNNELVMGRNLYEFLDQIESMTALGIDTLASVQKGHAYLVFFHDTPKDPEKFKENVEEITARREAVIPQDKEETPAITLVQTTVPEDTTEIKEEYKVKTDTFRSESEKEEILAKAESLRDDSKKAAAKNALDAFALTLSISLSRAKTFDGMLEDLKASL